MSNIRKVKLKHIGEARHIWCVGKKTKATKFKLEELKGKGHLVDVGVGRVRWYGQDSAGPDWVYVNGFEYGNQVLGFAILGNFFIICKV